CLHAAHPHRPLHSFPTRRSSDLRPIEMTDAATTPVVAASSAPTKITAYARPPRKGPNSCPIVSSRSSAMPLRSRISPMNVKKGRSEEHTSELQSLRHLVCRLLLE